jgi:hypothetical protein
MSAFDFGSLTGSSYHNIDIASIMLETGSLTFQVAIGVCTGYSTVPFNDSPMVSSSSPSDFWGRRWNQQVQSTLKVRNYTGINHIAVFSLVPADTSMLLYILAAWRLQAPSSAFPYSRCYVWYLPCKRTPS